MPQCLCLLVGAILPITVLTLGSEQRAESNQLGASPRNVSMYFLLIDSRVTMCSSIVSGEQMLCDSSRLAICAT